MYNSNYAFTACSVNNSNYAFTACSVSEIPLQMNALIVVKYSNVGWDQIGNSVKENLCLHFSVCH